jgi:hypothetical protein
MGTHEKDDGTGIRGRSQAVSLGEATAQDRQSRMLKVRQRSIQRENVRQVEVVLAFAQGFQDQSGTVKHWKRHR